MYALHLDTDGRVLSATYPQYAPADAVTVEALPEGDIHQYRYVDGELVHDPLPEQPTPEQEPDVYDELAAALREGVNSV